MATLNVVTQDRHVQALTAALRASDQPTKNELLLALGIGSATAVGGYSGYPNGQRINDRTRTSLASYTCPKDGAVSVTFTYWCMTNQAIYTMASIVRLRKNNEYINSAPGVYFRKENVPENVGALLGGVIACAYLPVTAGDIIHGIAELIMDNSGNSANAYQAAGHGTDGLAVSYI